MNSYLTSLACLGREAWWKPSNMAIVSNVYTQLTSVQFVWWNCLILTWFSVERQVLDPGHFKVRIPFDLEMLIDLADGGLNFTGMKRQQLRLLSKRQMCKTINTRY